MAVELIQSVTELEVAQIDVGGSRLRSYDEASVAALMQSIEEFGFTSTITVRRKKDRDILIDGGNRLEAMYRLGAKVIPVRLYRCNDSDAQALEISANLVGAAMTPIDDAVFLARWKRIYEEKHPEAKGRVLSANVRWHATELSSVASLVAQKRQISERQVRKIIAAGEHLMAPEIAALRQASKPVALKDLIEIGKIVDTGERYRVVELLSKGEAKTAAAARTVWKAEQLDVPMPEKDPVEEAYQTLLKAWTRAPKAARRKFLLEAQRDTPDMFWVQEDTTDFYEGDDD